MMSLAVVYVGCGSEPRVAIAFVVEFDTAIEALDFDV